MTALDQQNEAALLARIGKALASERRAEEQFEGQKTIERSADGRLSRVTTELGHGRYRVQDLHFDEQGEIDRVTSRIEQGPDHERAAELRKAAIMFAPDPHSATAYRGGS